MDEVRGRFAHVPERLRGLGDLAYNLWWSWHPAGRMLFKMLDRRAWKESGHNPVRMLRDLPARVLESAASQQDYLRHYDSVLERFRGAVSAQGGWFSESIRGSRCLPIAFFCAEYGLHHSLPFYAGGLGFLAGDYLKECSDLGVPVVGVGFMYPAGYFRQRIRIDGWQESAGEPLDRDAAPICRVLDAQGNQLVVRVPVISPAVRVSVWRVDVGRIPLYLLDTDIAANDPWNRSISEQLYGGDVEQRLRQEIVLGIGGSKVLETLGISHSLLHVNEGHPAFSILERIGKFMEEGADFEEASRRVRSTTVFTTHTPVPAGHDVFPFLMMDKYFSGYYERFRIGREKFLEMGMHPGDPSAGFNMAVFALRMSEYRNAVSKRHGEVAKRMWHSLWPGKEERDIPIDSITNGVHVPTWIEPKIELLFNRYLGPDWIGSHDELSTWGLIEEIPDRELWDVRFWLKIKLINYIREQARKRWARDGASLVNVVAGGALLDPYALTIGFARRFTGYKRADLIFHDVARLKGLVNDRWRPVQLIFAGKAHPADDEGKRIIQRIFAYAHDPEFAGRIAFVENYDEQLAQYMTHGVDVWLNNPSPPLEACGTSGMKATLNGVPHLSVLDGWWTEGYNGANGWAFDGLSEVADAEAIYRILEDEAIPLYYELDEEGLPRGWIRKVKDSIKGTGALFCTRRMVKEYATKFYERAIAEASAPACGRPDSST